MKNGFYFFVILLVIFLGILAGLTIHYSNENNLQIAKIETEILEYGEVYDEKYIMNDYEVYVKKFYSENTIDNIVNDYVDTIVEEFKLTYDVVSKVTPRNKAVLVSAIESYMVNDNIVSIKVTSKIKKLYSDIYQTQIQTFNFRLDTYKSVTLEDLFRPQYKEKISDIYSERYLLKEQEIIFYSNYAVNCGSCTYNELKEYNNSNLLNAQNYNITEEEYNSLFKKAIDLNKKMVAITFDDGPHSTNTEEILNILSKYNARATFFMLGENVEKYPDIVKKVYERGNEIGIHSWDHPQLTNLDAEGITSQIERTSDAVYNITGYRPKLVRPPYGAINSTVKETLDYPLIMWSIDSLDWKSRDENQIVPLVLDNVEDGDIILLHDIHATTIPAVERIVSSLTNERISIHNSFTDDKS